MWAVTIIGAPKKAAAQAIEDLENDARGWYGGAIGMLSLNGDINTGITIRTVHLKDGVARYAAGATLLYDSDPASEDEECRLKATTFFRALYPALAVEHRRAITTRRVGEGVRLLLVDNDDCFIHTLANYARQTGATVSTYRSNVALEAIDSGEARYRFDLARPGPARRFRRSDAWCRNWRSAAFRSLACAWDCKGLWRRLAESWTCCDYPMHGKGSHGDARGARRISRHCRRRSAWAAITRCMRIARQSPSMPGNHGGIGRRRHHGRAPSRSAD